MYFNRINSPYNRKDNKVITRRRQTNQNQHRESNKQTNKQVYSCRSFRTEGVDMLVLTIRIHYRAGNESHCLSILAAFFFVHLYSFEESVFHPSIRGLCIYFYLHHISFFFCWKWFLFCSLFLHNTFICILHLFFHSRVYSRVYWFKHYSLILHTDDVSFVTRHITYLICFMSRYYIFYLFCVYFDQL